jgi:hypothetical protein
VWAQRQSSPVAHQILTKRLLTRNFRAKTGHNAGPWFLSGIALAPADWPGPAPPAFSLDRFGRTGRFQSGSSVPRPIQFEVPRVSLQDARSGVAKMVLCNTFVVTATSSLMAVLRYQ